MDTKTKKEILNNLLDRVYDLILNPEILDDERAILINFKNEVGTSKNLELQALRMSDELRWLALEKFKNKSQLSQEVSKLYLDLLSIKSGKYSLGGGLAFLVNH